MDAEFERCRTLGTTLGVSRHVSISWFRHFVNCAVISIAMPTQRHLPRQTSMIGAGLDGPSDVLVSTDEIAWYCAARLEAFGIVWVDWSHLGWLESCRGDLDQSDLRPFGVTWENLGPFGVICGGLGIYGDLGSFGVTWDSSMTT